MYLCVLFTCCQVDLDFKDVCFFGFLFLFFRVLTGMAANLFYYGWKKRDVGKRLQQYLMLCSCVLS